MWTTGRRARPVATRGDDARRGVSQRCADSREITQAASRCHRATGRTAARSASFVLTCTTPMSRESHTTISTLVVWNSAPRPVSEGSSRRGLLTQPPDSAHMSVYRGLGTRTGRAHYTFEILRWIKWTCRRALTRLKHGRRMKAMQGPSGKAFGYVGPSVARIAARLCGQSAAANQPPNGGDRRRAGSADSDSRDDTREILHARWPRRLRSELFARYREILTDGHQIERRARLRGGRCCRSVPKRSVIVLLRTSAIRACVSFNWYMVAVLPKIRGIPRAAIAVLFAFAR